MPTGTASTANVLAVALSLTLSAGATTSARELFSHQKADYRPTELARRFDTLRPLIEDVLGAPFVSSPIFGLLSPSQVEALLLEESVIGSLSFRQPAPRALRVSWARAEARLVRSQLVGKVDVATGTVHVIPETLEGIGLLGGMTQSLLDLVLVHESVHAWQHQRVGLPRLAMGAATEEQDDARGAFLEGHAEFVTEEVARRIGGRDLLITYRRAFGTERSRHGTANPEPDGSMAFAYIEPREMFEKAIPHFGNPLLAFDRLSIAPWLSRSEIRHPAGDFLPHRLGVDLAQLGEEIRRLLPGRPFSSGVPIWTLQWKFPGSSDALQRSYLGGRSAQVGGFGKSLELSALAFEDEETSLIALRSLEQHPPRGTLGHWMSGSAFVVESSSNRGLVLRGDVEDGGSCIMTVSRVGTYLIAAAALSEPTDAPDVALMMELTRIAQRLKSRVRAPEFAENGGLFGRMLAEPGAMGVPGAGVGLKSASAATTWTKTDALGRYVFWSVPPGLHRLVDSGGEDLGEVEITSGNCSQRDVLGTLTASRTRTYRIRVTHDDGTTPTSIEGRAWCVSHGNVPVPLARTPDGVEATVTTGVWVLGALTVDGELREETCGLPIEIESLQFPRQPTTRVLVRDAVTHEPIDGARAWSIPIDTDAMGDPLELAGKVPWFESDFWSGPIFTRSDGSFPMGTVRSRQALAVFAPSRRTGIIGMRRDSVGDLEITLEDGAGLALKIPGVRDLHHGELVANTPDGWTTLPIPRSGDTLNLDGLAPGFCEFELWQGNAGVGRLLGVATAELRVRRSTRVRLAATLPAATRHQRIRLRGLDAWPEEQRFLEGSLDGNDEATRGIQCGGAILESEDRTHAYVVFQRLVAGAYRFGIPALRGEYDIEVASGSEISLDLPAPSRWTLRLQNPDGTIRPCEIEAYEVPFDGCDSPDPDLQFAFLSDSILADPKTLSLPPGLTDLAIRGEGVATTWLRVDARAGVSETLTVALAPPGRVRATLRLESGRMVSGNMSVCLRGGGHAYRRNVLPARFASLLIDDVPPGTYTLEVQALEGTLEASATILVVSETTAAVALTLRAPEDRR